MESHSHHFLGNIPVRNVPTAKLFVACAEGNERPLPQLTNKMISSNIWQGRERPIQGLITCADSWSAIPTINRIIITIQIASRFLFLIRINSPNIYTGTQLLNSVAIGISQSVTGFDSEPLINLKSVRSIFWIISSIGLPFSCSWLHRE